MNQIPRCSATDMKSRFALIIALVMAVFPVMSSSGNEAGTILRILDGVVERQAEQEHQARERERKLELDIQRRTEELERREQELEHRERRIHEKEARLHERERKLRFDTQRHTKEREHRTQELERRERQVLKQPGTGNKFSDSSPKQSSASGLTHSGKINRFLQTGEAPCELAMELVLYDIPGPGGYGPRQLRLEHSDLGHSYDNQIDLVKIMRASHVEKIRALIKRVYPDDDNYIGPLWNLYAWTDKC